VNKNYDIHFILDFKKNTNLKVHLTDYTSIGCAVVRPLSLMEYTTILKVYLKYIRINVIAANALAIQLYRRHFLKQLLNIAAVAAT